jgi:hypothetical protein
MKTLLLPILCVVLSSGCVAYKSYNGPSPVIPRQAFLTSPEKGVTVDSVRPTFKWCAVRPDATYEFAIWETINYPAVNRARPGANAEKGPLIYSLKNLKVTEHVLAMDLLPSTSYFWSIREEGKEWMTVNWFIMSPGGWSNVRNWPFLFKTPRESRTSPFE